MSRVYVVIEGPTEEAFVRDVLRQTLYQRDIYLIPRVIGRPGHQGGRVTYERAKRDVSLFLKQEPGLAPEFRHIRNQFASPEDINDDPENAPSKRIIALHPRYRKVLNGVQAASAVGIDAMRRECPHFNQWIATLERMITP